MEEKLSKDNWFLEISYLKSQGEGQGKILREGTLGGGKYGTNMWLQMPANSWLSALVFIG